MKKIIIIALALVLASPFALNAQITIGGTSGGNPPASTGGSSGSNAPASTGGTSGGNPQGVQKLSNPLPGVSSLGDLVKSGVRVFSYIAVLIGVLMFVIVGLQYILARGNPEKMKAASQWLLYICIGVAIVIGATLAVNVIINTLDATGAVDPKIIQSAKDANK